MGLCGVTGEFKSYFRGIKTGEKYGAPRKIRTSDRSVRSRVLYPAELWVHRVTALLLIQCH